VERSKEQFTHTHTHRNVGNPTKLTSGRTVIWKNGLKFLQCSSLTGLIPHYKKKLVVLLLESERTITLWYHFAHKLKYTMFLVSFFSQFGSLQNLAETRLKRHFNFDSKKHEKVKHVLYYDIMIAEAYLNICLCIKLLSFTSQFTAQHQCQLECQLQHAQERICSLLFHTE